jgi:hypothetical protein
MSESIIERPSGKYRVTWERETIDLGDQVDELKETWDFGLLFPDGSHSDPMHADSEQGMKSRVLSLIEEFERGTPSQG